MLLLLFATIYSVKKFIIGKINNNCMFLFYQNEALEVKVTSMSSTKTHLPFDYYSLPFCRPENRTIAEPINLGEVLLGERILNTPYRVRFLCIWYFI